MLPMPMPMPICPAWVPAWRCAVCGPPPHTLSQYHIKLLPEGKTAPQSHEDAKAWLVPTQAEIEVRQGGTWRRG